MYTAKELKTLNNAMDAMSDQTVIEDYLICCEMYELNISIAKNTTQRDTEYAMDLFHYELRRRMGE